MKLLSSIEQACPKKKRKVDEFPGISTAPPTDVSLGDELHLDGEDVAMAHADALDDFDLDMLGDGDSPGPGSAAANMAYPYDVPDYASLRSMARAASTRLQKLLDK
nr:VP16 transactivation domain (modified) [Cloning vector pVP-HA2]